MASESKCGNTGNDRCGSGSWMRDQAGVLPVLVYASPRKLPSAEKLAGRVVVLDLAFAGKGLGKSFEKSTGKLILGLGERLAAWVDHHDNERHADYADDPRFVLSGKTMNRSCAEMVTPELVKTVGHVDTLVTHADLDGLYSAAKWILGGRPPYPGADEDARAVDSRIGKAGDIGILLDQALRGRQGDEPLLNAVVRYLVFGWGVNGGLDPVKSDVLNGALRYDAVDEESDLEYIRGAAEDFSLMNAEAKKLASGYRVEGRVAFVDVGEPLQRFDKTGLLLTGQDLAEVAIVKHGGNITVAAPFNSGWDFVGLLGLGGGMPTRITVRADRLEELLTKLNKSA